MDQLFIQLFPYAASAFGVVIGLVTILFRRRFARGAIRRVAEPLEEHRLAVYEALYAIVGIGLVVAASISFLDLLFEFDFW